MTRARAVDGLRPQRAADSYGLLQPYQGSTPKLVQMAEGKRSRSWDLPVAGVGGAGPGPRRAALGGGAGRP